MRLVALFFNDLDVRVLPYRSPDQGSKVKLSHLAIGGYIQSLAHRSHVTDTLVDQTAGYPNVPKALVYADVLQPQSPWIVSGLLKRKVADQSVLVREADDVGFPDHLPDVEILDGVENLTIVRPKVMTEMPPHSLAIHQREFEIGQSWFRHHRVPWVSSGHLSTHPGKARLSDAQCHARLRAATFYRVIHMEKDQEVYISAHHRVCFEDADSTHSFYSEDELLQTVGQVKMDQLKSENGLFWSTYGVTEDGPAYALEDFDNEAAAAEQAKELNTKFELNAKPVSLPENLQEMVDTGEVPAGREKEFEHYYNAFKNKAESAYSYGAMADENLEEVARAFSGLSEDVLKDFREIGTEARKEVDRIAEKFDFSAQTSGFRI